MPAQKRPASASPSPAPSPSPPPPAAASPAGTNGHAPAPPLPPAAADVELTTQGDEEKPAPKAEEEAAEAAVIPLVQYDSDKEGSSSSRPSSPTAADQEEFILVKLADIRKEVQCPICLGIIRKTRTVMECLHRFCRQCIDKSMRLGNNECPACRTHCASRRSLRDDPNYDALIAALYPDIDEYEEEELAFHEEERTRNRQIQASIAETYRRQTEALGRKRSAKATAAAFVRKSQRNFHNNGLRAGGRNAGRETVLIGSDEDDGDEEDEEDEQDANGNDAGKYSSAEERSPESRHKKRKRLQESCTSPAVTAGNSVLDSEENEEVETSRENHKTPPLHSSHIEKLAWGKGGVRSQTRHGSASTLRYNKGGRLSKLAELLRSSDSKDDEVNVHLTLQPMDEGSAPSLEEPHIYCRPSVSVGHLCQFIANKTSSQVEEVEILVRKSREEKPLPIAPASGLDKPHIDLSVELQILGLQESLAGLCDSFTGQGDLVLLYRLKV